MKVALWIWLFTVQIGIAFCDTNRPNIVFILADDLGWNDVGFHGSSQIPTPNLDSLAFAGVSLHRYYVNPICTPSRSALMTGKYPIHTGMQHGVIYGMETRGLPLTERILPEYLKDLGYTNHIVGKWHLGSFKKEYTPTYRGFDSHLGFWTGHQDYFDHTNGESGTWGFDMRRNMTSAFDLHGKYATHVISQESVRIVENHDTKSPLFLYVAHAAVHSGNTEDPLRAPSETIAKMGHIHDFNRRRFAAMVSEMDDSVGKLVKALKKKNMLENTIIVFSTDNGGPAEGFNLNAASNWPLKGVKNTPWEGGLRGAGFVWSPLIKNPKRVSNQMIQIADWLPTLLSAAGGDPNAILNIDGINAWNAISFDEPSNRTTTLHNIDDEYGYAAITVGKWKLVNGTTYGGKFDNWYGPAGDRDSNSYSYMALQQSDVGSILFDLHYLPSATEITDLRDQNSIQCYRNTPNATTSCRAMEEPCLFDVESDPCELNNVAKLYPNFLKTFYAHLDRYRQSSVPPNNTPLDQRGNPKNWNNVWENFGDKTEL